MYLPISVCVFCFGDISRDHVMTCENNRFVRFRDGESLPSIPYVPANILKGTRCPDCNVHVGGYHHPGCSKEICPRCGGKLLRCGCINDDRGS